MLQEVLAGRHIKAVVLDVRGTIIHPSLDEPLSSESAHLILRLLDSQVVVALNTATSIQSLKSLVIAPLLSARPESAVQLDNYLMYVDSSTAAYKLTEEKESTAFGKMLKEQRYDLATP